MENHTKNQSINTEENAEYWDQIFCNLLEEILFTWKTVEEEVLVNKRIPIVGHDGTAQSYRKIKNPFCILNNKLNFQISPEEAILLASKEWWQWFQQRMFFNGFSVRKENPNTISIWIKPLSLKVATVSNQIQRILDRQNDWK